MQETPCSYVGESVSVTVKSPQKNYKWKHECYCRDLNPGLNCKTAEGLPLGHQSFDVARQLLYFIMMERWNEELLPESLGRLHDTESLLGLLGAGMSNRYYVLNFPVRVPGPVLWLAQGQVLVLLKLLIIFQLPPKSSMPRFAIDGRPGAGITRNMTFIFIFIFCPGLPYRTVVLVIFILSTFFNAHLAHVAINLLWNTITPSGGWRLYIAINLL